MADFIVPPSTPIPKPRPLNIERMPSVETILFDLRHHKSFITPLTDLSDPYIHSMQTFQTFTTSLIQSLETNDSAVVELAQNNTLQELCSDFPSFYEQDAFRAWVKDGTLKHPQRQTVKQHQFLHVVELKSEQDPSMSFVDIITSAVAAAKEWREATYDPMNLVNDPDALHFFTSHIKHSLEPVSLAELDEDDSSNPSDTLTLSPASSCPICTCPFDPHTRIPKRAPCTHIFCSPCLHSWLQKSTLTCSCPMCRACIVCGRNPCIYHNVPREPALPMPLPGILDVVLVDRNKEALYGLSPQTYWILREKTRKDRVGLKAVRDVLGVMGEGEEVLREAMERVENETAESIRRIILGVLSGKGGGSE